MGTHSSNLRSRSKVANVLVVGLDGSGKTALLRKVTQQHPHASKQVVATQGFSIFRLSQMGFKLNCIDVGGGPARRTIWHKFYERAHAIIFVVDSTDLRRLEKVGTILQSMLEDSRLARVPLLILANKQDMFTALSGTEISDALNCSQIRGRLWQIQHTSSLTGEGLQTAFEWLTRTFCETSLSAKEMKKIRFSLKSYS